MDALEVHQLLIVKGTQMGIEYQKRPFPTLSLEQYIDALIIFLEHLSPIIQLERLMATSPKEYLLSPWPNINGSHFKELLMNKMKEKQSYQGIAY